MTAVIYARYSSDNQREESIEGQIRECTAYAEKNGIMMVDFALAAQRNEGLSAQQAIYQAALMRFRPILMTTLAALVGAIPLMLASGSGAELRQPLGIVMVGGLILSQLLTLFTTPVVYLFFDRLQRPQKTQPAVPAMNETGDAP